MIATGRTCVALVCLLAVGADRRPSPKFSALALPEPPRQRQPWAAPKTGLPKTLLTATAALFDAGLADPRGCEYRAVEVGTGNCWSGDGGVVATHAWVLPAKKGDPQRFAVGWNGLVYPVVSVGKPADLKADVRAAVKEDEKRRAAARGGFYRFRHAWEESHSVAHGSLLPLKACLLLRLGEGELARGVWDAWVAGMKPDTNDDAVHLRDPYLMLATDWVWARFDRAVCAHMRGDDRLALLDLRAVSAGARAVDAEAGRRGLPRLSFLDPLPALLADQERRARAKPREKLPRIAALISDLEDAAARQMGQPGGVSLGMDATVQALVKEGELAVEPLLKCLEEDQRLTRSVGFHRDFFRHRHVLSVHEAAYWALAGILQEESLHYGPGGEFLSLRNPAERKKVAAAVRAYWKKFGTIPIEERWLIVLKDDKATPPQWLQAAANVVGRDRTTGGGPMRGEPLRKKKAPSVSELLVRRVDALSQAGEGASQRLNNLYTACQLAEHLADWDVRAALPVLRQQVRRCRDHIANPEARGSHAFSYMGRFIARFTQRRLRAGDDGALPDYAAWVRTIGPRDESHSFAQVLEPLWENPTHPDVVKAAEALFGDRSPWAARFLRAFNTHDLATTPLVGLAAFRRRLLAELADKRPAGKLKLDVEGVGYLELTDAYSGGRGIHSKGDPRAPKPGTEVAFRVCDYYAWELSRLEGAPRCELYWPAADRDRAVAACAAFLRRHGERFQYTPEVEKLPSPSTGVRARLTFPRLGRPATAEDVKQGRAIFTLGDGKVRVADAPALPAKARWKAYKGAERVVSSWDAKQGRTVTTKELDRDGLVWQAEEVYRDGKWVLYYGFVGRHVVARVPADEVEFPPRPAGVKKE